MINFIVPQQILTGPECLNQLPDIIADLNLTKNSKISSVMLVIGRNWARKSGYLDKITNLLAIARVKTELFEGVPAEPPTSCVELLRTELQKHKSQLVIAMGGGSVLDVAKAAAILVYSDKSVIHHLDSQILPNQSLPLIAIPTTAGTGSEATPACVLNIEKTNIKKSFRSSAMMPIAAIVDPKIMLNCPKHIIANSGMDALAQAIEAYSSKFANNLSDALTEKAITLIANNLTKLYNDPGNLDAQQTMADGSLMAGMALANVRLGAVHGLAHPIGGQYHLAHGLVCAILLPPVLNFNKSALKSTMTSTKKLNKYDHLQHLLGEEPVMFTKNLLNHLNIPQDFKHLNMKKADMEILAEQSLNSGSTRANPRECTKEDMLSLLKKIT